MTEIPERPAENQEEWLLDKLIEWRKLARALERLETEMTPTMKILKKTVAIGRAIAKYFPGRRTFDYEVSGKEADAEIVEKHTTVFEGVEIDWEGICKHLEVDDSVVKQFTVETETKNVDWKAVCKEAKIDPIVSDPGTPKISYGLKSLPLVLVIKK